MRIYIKNPGKFAKYKGKIVLTHFNDEVNTVIRDHNDDVHRVKTTKLEYPTVDELHTALETEIGLREVAEAEDYIVVGEPKYDDMSYFYYIATHS